MVVVIATIGCVVSVARTHVNPKFCGVKEKIVLWRGRGGETGGDLKQPSKTKWPNQSQIFLGIFLPRYCLGMA